MRHIAHLSDLHFGRTDARVVQALREDLDRQRPDLVIVSGDLTQRAKAGEFAEARAFLAHLPCPSLVVPGNHDLVPLHRPLSRLLRPRDRFERHLPDHRPWPVWHDDEVTAIGLDSTRHLRWISGKLRASHLEHVEQVVTAAPDHACKLAFLHHPPPTALDGHPFERLAERGVDVVCTGHVHRAHVEVITGHGPTSCILVQASTACSTRLRDDANGYALIRIAMPEVEVILQGWTGERFHPRHQMRFVKSGGVWRDASPHNDRHSSDGGTPCRPQYSGGTMDPRRCGGDD